MIALVAFRVATKMMVAMKKMMVAMQICALRLGIVLREMIIFQLLHLKILDDEVHHLAAANLELLAIHLWKTQNSKTSSPSLQKRRWTIPRWRMVPRRWLISGGGQQEGGNHVKFWWLPCKRPPWPHPIEISKTTKRLQRKIKFCKYCTVMYDDLKSHINCDDTQYKKTDYWRELMSVSVEHHFVPTKRCLRPKSLTFLQL